ncbi:hypothetical protein OH799_00935 [Nocardia sp. NBC_00881]|nr:hypothetical protein OH799_00935 [Nocardia sp. NBC_00881]
MSQEIGDEQLGLASLTPQQRQQRILELENKYTRAKAEAKVELDSQQER